MRENEKNEKTMMKKTALTSLVILFLSLFLAVPQLTCGVTNYGVTLAVVPAHAKGTSVSTDRSDIYGRWVLGRAFLQGNDFSEGHLAVDDGVWVTNDWIELDQPIEYYTEYQNTHPGIPMSGAGLYCDDALTKAAQEDSKFGQAGSNNLRIVVMANSDWNELIGVGHGSAFFGAQKIIAKEDADEYTWAHEIGHAYFNFGHSEVAWTPSETNPYHCIMAPTTPRENILCMDHKLAAGFVDLTPLDKAGLYTATFRVDFPNFRVVIENRVKTYAIKSWVDTSGHRCKCLDKLDASKPTYKDDYIGLSLSGTQINLYFFDAQISHHDEDGDGKYNATKEETIFIEITVKRPGGALSPVTDATVTVNIEKVDGSYVSPPPSLTHESDGLYKGSHKLNKEDPPGTWTLSGSVTDTYGHTQDENIDTQYILVVDIDVIKVPEFPFGTDLSFALSIVIVLIVFYKRKSSYRTATRFF